MRAVYVAALTQGSVGLTWVATVFEPTAAVLRRDAIASSPCNPTKRVLRSRCVTTDKLLLQSPRRFDRIEVRRVRRQVHHLDAPRPADAKDSVVVVSLEVVHHDDVASSKLRKQLRPEPPDETVFSRLLVGRGEHDPSVAPHRTQQSQVLAPDR